GIVALRLHGGGELAIDEAGESVAARARFLVSLLAEDVDGGIFADFRRGGAERKLNLNLARRGGVNVIDVQCRFVGGESGSRRGYGQQARDENRSDRFFV